MVKTLYSASVLSQKYEESSSPEFFTHLVLYDEAQSFKTSPHVNRRFIEKNPDLAIACNLVVVTPDSSLRVDPKILFYPHIPPAFRRCQEHARKERTWFMVWLPPRPDARGLNPFTDFTSLHFTSQFLAMTWNRFQDGNLLVNREIYVPLPLKPTIA